MISNQVCKGSDILIEMPRQRPKWYFSKKEIEDNSPSRMDGIDLIKENQLRMQYCSFIQELGMRLGMPQVAIATAMMFCHRFYLRQSHAKNDWQTIATVCVFLASKVEEPPCSLSKVIHTSYEMVHQKDPKAVKTIQFKDAYEKQKELIWMGERLVLSTIEFDLDIQHPYKPLVAALKRLRISESSVLRVAWNFVNDWMRTTLCLQYKPHYIAAGSISLAARLNKVKLPSEKGRIWWHEFDITPRQFEEVIQQMMELFGCTRRDSTLPSTNRKESPASPPVQKESPNSPESCVLSRPGSSSSTGYDLPGEAGEDQAGGDETARHDSSTLLSSSGIPAKDIPSTGENMVPESLSQVPESPDGIVDLETTQHVSNPQQSSKGQAQPTSTAGLPSKGIMNMDKERIRAALKSRRQERVEMTEIIISDDCSEDAWIEKELEAGIEHEGSSGSYSCVAMILKITDADMFMRSKGRYRTQFENLFAEGYICFSFISCNFNSMILKICKCLDIIVTSGLRKDRLRPGL